MYSVFLRVLTGQYSNTEVQYSNTCPCCLYFRSATAYMCVFVSCIVYSQLLFPNYSCQVYCVFQLTYRVSQLQYTTPVLCIVYCASCIVYSVAPASRQRQTAQRTTTSEPTVLSTRCPCGQQVLARQAQSEATPGESPLSGQGEGERAHSCGIRGPPHHARGSGEPLQT